jgi:predicted ABC-type ATPase
MSRGRRPEVIFQCRHAAEELDAFETTLAGRGYLRLIQRLRSSGWHIELFYLALPSVELSRERVAERVLHGGHSIADEDIIRRFPRSLRNLFEAYADAVDYTHCFLNSGPMPEQVFVQSGTDRSIQNQAVYNQLMTEAAR